MQVLGYGGLHARLYTPAFPLCVVMITTGVKHTCLGFDNAPFYSLQPFTAMCFIGFLQVYKGTEHPHEAQQPVCITNEISKKPKETAGAALLAAKKAEAAK
jgi:hypothetical protein